MELWLAALIIVGAAVLSAAGMLIVRRRAPAGTFFKDPIPAGAVYTVVGTAYMVIVAFVFFIAFESYGGAKADAEKEATATLAMFHADVPFGPAARAELQGQMICYAREVISDEWPAMREGEASSVVDARVSAMEESAEQIPVTDAKQAAAFEHWFTLNEERRQGRQGRIGKAEGLVPPVIWLILIIGAVVVIASVALFADREEAAVTQAAMVAAVAIIVVSGLVLVRFLDRPYEGKSGSIKPTAMERTLAQMERGGARSSGHPVHRLGRLREKAPRAVEPCGLDHRADTELLPILSSHTHRRDDYAQPEPRSFSSVSRSSGSTQRSWRASRANAFLPPTQTPIRKRECATRRRMRRVTPSSAVWAIIRALPSV